MSGLVHEHYVVRVSHTRVGTLHRRGDHTRFSLDPAYLRDPERPVLGLRIEQTPESGLATAMRLPAWFSNLLPEGPLRQWIARQRVASPQREMELLAQVGHDLPGAVTVLLDDEPGAPWPEHSAPTGSIEMGLGKRLKFSLAGVAMKFSMLERDDRLTLPASGEGGDWIVKLPDHQFRDVPRNEFAMMSLARAAGIDVPDIRLINRDELSDLPASVWPSDQDEAYAIRRFDRTPTGRVHMEDLAQVRGFYPEQKYSGSFESVAANIYRDRDADSLREFARRLAISLLVRNGDAHLKNWSLLYRDPQVPAISPLYDLVSTAPYSNLLGCVEDLALPLGGSKQFERVSLSAFANLERRLSARVGLMDVARETITRAVAAWPDVRELLTPCPELRSEIDDIIDEAGRRLLGRH